MVEGAPERRERPPGYLENHWVIYALFLFFVFARYVQLTARRDVFAAMRLEFALGLPLAILCIILLMQRSVDIRPARSLIAGIAGLFLAMLVQLPFAANPVLAKTVFFDRVVKFAFLTFFMLTLVRSPRYLKLFLLTFLFSCFVVVQESLRGLITGGLVWENQGVMRLHGPVPIYGHPNSLGGMAMGVVPFCVFLLPVWRQWYLRAGLLALLTGAVVVVLYTGSRTAYVAFLGFLLFWWASSRNKLKAMLIGIATGLVVVAVIPQQYKARFQSIGGEEAEGQSKATRFEILRDAWDIFLENPGGVGVASFTAVRMKKFGRAQDTHNLYLEVATNLGVQGLIIFAAMVWSTLAVYRRTAARLAQQDGAMRRLTRRTDSTPGFKRELRRHLQDLGLLRAACKAAAGFLYVRLWLGLFGMDLYEVYWWFAAGLAISLAFLADAASDRSAWLLERGDSEYQNGTRQIDADA